MKRKSFDRIGIALLLVFALSVHAATDFPNRTLPSIEPPKTGLEFSANPTTLEIFRARVFEEPLVPIGGEPSADENAALADALLGYAKRSGPDDFASLTGFLEKHPHSPWRAPQNRTEPLQISWSNSVVLENAYAAHV
jgi:hypothetical protein